MNRHSFALLFSANPEEYQGWKTYLEDEAEYYRNELGAYAK